MEPTKGLEDRASREAAFANALVSMVFVAIPTTTVARVTCEIKKLSSITILKWRKHTKETTIVTNSKSSRSKHRGGKIAKKQP